MVIHDIFEAAGGVLGDFATNGPSSACIFATKPDGPKLPAQKTSPSLGSIASVISKFKYIFIFEHCFSKVRRTLIS